MFDWVLVSYSYNFDLYVDGSTLGGDTKYPIIISNKFIQFLKIRQGLYADMKMYAATSL